MTESSEPRVVTLGCRLNACEGEAMARHAAAAGLGNSILVNTCAVTNEAVRKAAQTIRKLARENPEARIVVTGCAAQLEPRRFSEMDEVDHVIGNADKVRPATYEALAREPGRRLAVSDIMDVRQTAQHMAERFATRARAAVEIQNGCDHRCTFCIIPFARGPSRSVPPETVVFRIRRLIENGYREVVLTGVDITSYGADLGQPPLGALVRKILTEVPSLERLRLTSIDSIEADADLLRAVAEEERLMPHLHLSLQAGDDLILKRMKRRHTRQDAIRFCAEARRLRPDIVFGADLIAGFPTETDAEHAGSLALIDDCGLTYLHVFPYSARAGTPAARMPQVPGPAIRARADALRQKGAQALAAYLDHEVGREVDVLLERGGLAHTPQFGEVRIAAPAAPGDIVRVRIKGHDGRQMLGEVIA